MFTFSPRMFCIVLLVGVTTAWAQQPATEINRAALDSAVSTAADRMFAEALGLASRVARDTEDRAVREMTVRMKIRVSEIVDAVQREPDPRQRFVLLWTYAVQFRLFVTSDAQTPPFGDAQDDVVQFADDIVARVESIGREFFSAEQIDAARDDVQQMADAMRTGSFLMHPVSAVRGEEIRKKGDLGALMLRPLTPLSGVSAGMTDAASAVNRFSDVAATGVQTAQRMPQRVRWEMELILLELDSLQSVAAVVEQSKAMREELRAAREAVEKLPARTRLEVDQSVRTVTDALPRVQETIASTQETIKQLDEAVARTQNLTASVQEALGTVATAGKQWGDTAVEIRKLLEQYEAMKPAETSGETEPTDWGQVAQAAESVRQATSELRMLLMEIQEAGESQDVITKALADVQQTAAESVDRTGDRADALVDKITWRLIVVLLVFAAAWWAGQWWLRRRTSETR